ncbi:hypothetical protein [Sphingomonas parapaucimobilis]|uniref:Uncharacterized protein n=1 Tax=Sphingomonas parapaucimobilis NBRC 15100 TaxID=1219049 RepID=A0A0A1W8Z8_9SPHN|nr:hypothetical protein [Sphingomonas parapaucimobilis]GAM01915.1 hypothetical protein SP5_069_01590 [Sphingomonas parapaucimobilis NBRC 15100]
MEDGAGLNNDQKTPRRVGDGTPGPGRPKGVQNKNTTLLKDAILQAATQAGGEAGLVGYLVTQATNNPNAFMPLLGKVLPMQVTGEDGGPIQVTRIELVAVQPE